MSPRTRALAAVVAALLLIGGVVLVAGSMPRRWHLVVVDLVGATTDAPEATPRLQALERAGGRVRWTDGRLPASGELDELSADLAARGWRSLPPVGATYPRGATDAALELAFAEAGRTPGRLLIRVTYPPAPRPELDRELGRLIDGLAAPLPATRTLYVVLDWDAGSALLAGPRAVAGRRLPRPERGAADFGVWMGRVLQL